MTHQDLDQLIESANPEQPLTADHQAQLLRSVDALISAEPANTTTKRTSLMRFAAVAASVGVLAGGSFAFQSIRTPAASWAAGLPMSAKATSEYIQACKEYATGYTYDEETDTYREPYLWQLREAVEDAQPIFAEDRGERKAIWLKTTAGLDFTCYTDGSWEGTDATVWFAVNGFNARADEWTPMPYTSINTEVEFGTHTVETTRFLKTNPKYVRYIAVTAAGEQTQGHIKNGHYSVVQRHVYTVEEFPSDFEPFEAAKNPLLDEGISASISGGGVKVDYHEIDVPRITLFTEDGSYKTISIDYPAE